MATDASVLVVDDIRANRFILRKHLEGQGIRLIFEAENGLQALDILQARPIDLVLLDVMMPEMDGYQVLEKMKAEPRWREIPVIMITALDDLESAVKCIADGAEDYLLKPFNPVMLKARISACLEKKRLRDIEREYLRLYDPATGLANRVFFISRLDEEIQRAKRHRLLFAVALVRLGRHRTVQEGLGQAAADAFVRAQADRLIALLPQNAVLARSGDNDLAVLLRDLNYTADGDHQALAVLKALDQPLEIQGHDVSGNTAVGMAYSASNYTGAGEMLRDAGLAAARVGSRGGLQIFDEAMHAEAMQRLDLEPEFRRAIDAGQLVLYYQPIVELNAGQLVGMEGLVRWRHPVRGMIPPNDFIKLAEETGLILPLGAWVLAEACRQTAAWEAAVAGARRFTVSVNVSAHQFTDPVFLTTLQQAMAAAGVDARRIKLELTETALVDNPGRVEQVLRQVRDFQVQTALDDFGTGYCSMSYLHRFPFDTLKIDQSFVRRLEDKPRNCQIVASTIDLAHKLGMSVVAEGVETPAEAKTLIGLGCEYAQGSLFRMPLPVGEAERLIGVKEG